MRAPSSTLPDVIVLESLPEGLDRKEVLDPKEDLWLTSADGYVVILPSLGSHIHTRAITTIDYRRSYVLKHATHCNLALSE
jgi:hypothetical protein